MSGPLALEGRVALVTGAGSQIGIGRAATCALADAGAAVFANDVVADDLERTVAWLREGGAEVDGYVADVSDPAAVNRMVAACERRFGRVDVLVNNAGIARKSDFLSMSEQEFRRTLDVNLGGSFYCSRAAARRMVELRSGRIVNLSSLMGCAWGWPDHVHYNASKAAVEGLTRGLATELGPFGITVNAVAPGLIETAQSTSREHSLGPEGLALAAPYVPLRRIGTPEEIASTILFFSSDASRYVTGQVLLVDGGITLGDLRPAFAALGEQGDGEARR